MGGSAQAVKHGHARSCLPAALDGCRPAAPVGAPVALAPRLSARGLALPTDSLAPLSPARRALLAVAAMPACLGHSSAATAPTAPSFGASDGWGAGQRAGLMSRS